jgi:DNA polymerase-1
LNTFSGLKYWIENTIKSAYELGYVETLFGRRRRLPNLKSREKRIRSEAERQSINAPIQGSGSDMTLLSFYKIVKFIKDNHLKSRCIATVHDSIVCDIYLPELPDMYEYIGRTMENIHNGWFETSVPFVADPDVGPNYGELYDYRDKSTIITNPSSMKLWLDEQRLKKLKDEVIYLRKELDYNDKRIKVYLKKHGVKHSLESLEIY